MKSAYEASLECSAYEATELATNCETPMSVLVLARICSSCVLYGVVG